jgi:hypothetical protein
MDNDYSTDPAEALDGDEFGEQPGDVDLPGTVGYPPAHPHLLDLDDPNAGDHDEADPSGVRAGIRLVDSASEDGLDVEAELLADEVPLTGDISAEEAAMHIERNR